VELYKVPEKSTVRVIRGIQTPPASPEIKAGDILKFYHIDGMYSTCKNESGEWVYLVAWAEVEIIDPQSGH
jgi:hypothetical protein